jgi:hypothetical protein
MLVLPEMRVGTPIGHESLILFPIFTEPAGTVDYLLSDEALAGGGVMIEEVDEAGRVSNLLVQNRADRPVLFLEGEELRGAKQNRVLNVSVLVPAMGRTIVEVRCVERGRWHYLSRTFGKAGAHASYKLRGILKKSVAGSISAGDGLGGTDQGAVWNEVDRQMAALGSRSSTAAMVDTYTAHQDRIVEFTGRLTYVEGATGLVAAVGGKIVLVDLFDKPDTCRKVWNRLLTGVILDALEIRDPIAMATQVDAQAALEQLRRAEWVKGETVGSGEEFQAELRDTWHASALVVDGTALHISMVCAS